MAMGGASLAQEERVGKRFVEDTKDHELTIYQDDGHYRHMRVGEPGSVFDSYHITTFPGHLVMTGDRGTYVFHRLTDMFEFFRSDEWRINTGYWQEKLQAPSPESVYVFDRDSFNSELEHRAAEYDEFADLPDEVRQAIDDLKAQYITSFEEAYAAIDEVHRDLDVRHGFFEDPWEWMPKEGDYHFVWACYAIVKAIKMYDETKAA